MKNIDKDRLYHGFYLCEWEHGLEHIGKEACMLCELCDECDRLADDLNKIEYCMCLSKGVIKDTEYKKKYPDAYFKKIED